MLTPGLDEEPDELPLGDLGELSWSKEFSERETTSRPIFNLVGRGFPPFFLF